MQLAFKSEVLPTVICQQLFANCYLPTAICQLLFIYFTNPAKITSQGIFQSGIIST